MARRGAGGPTFALGEWINFDSIEVVNYRTRAEPFLLLDETSIQIAAFLLIGDTEIETWLGGEDVFNEMLEECVHRRRRLERSCWRPRRRPDLRLQSGRLAGKRHLDRGDARRGRARRGRVRGVAARRYRTAVHRKPRRHGPHPRPHDRSTAARRVHRHRQLDRRDRGRRPDRLRVRSELREQMAIFTATSPIQATTPKSAATRFRSPTRTMPTPRARRCCCGSTSPTG